MLNVSSFYFPVIDFPFPIIQVLSSGPKCSRRSPSPLDANGRRQELAVLTHQIFGPSKQPITARPGSGPDISAETRFHMGRVVSSKQRNQTLSLLKIDTLGVI